MWFFNIQISPLSLSSHGRGMKDAAVEQTSKYCPAKTLNFEPYNLSITKYKQLNQIIVV